MNRPLRVAIIGAGASGTLLAVHLLRERSMAVEVSLIDRTGVFGPGVAYGATDPDHTLNVAAHQMGGVDQDDIDGFVRWAHPGATPLEHARHRLDYPARGAFGAYLRHLLDQARAGHAPHSRLRLVAAEALDVERLAADGQVVTRVRLDGGTVIDADRLILCLGNLPPPPLYAPGDARIIEAPWAPDALAAVPADAAVVIVGSGLSMVDAVISLDNNGFRGRITAVSRHGIMPVADAPVVPYADFFAPESARAGIRAVMRALRAEVAAAAARGIGWHSVVEAFRVHAGAIWAHLDMANRRRFLRHVRSPWLVYRHRIPPRHMARLERLVAAGRLEVRAARVLEVTADTDGCAVRIAPRGCAAPETLAADSVINCTGPQTDMGTVRLPLIESLLAGGWVRPDAWRLGFEVDADLTAIGAQGQPSEGIHVVGSHTRGRFWEITAVPHIRRQIETLVRHLKDGCGYC